MTNQSKQCKHKGCDLEAKLDADNEYQHGYCYQHGDYRWKCFDNSKYLTKKELLELALSALEPEVCDD